MQLSLLLFFSIKPKRIYKLDAFLLIRHTCKTLLMFKLCYNLRISFPQNTYSMCLVLTAQGFPGMKKKRSPSSCCQLNVVTLPSACDVAGTWVGTSLTDRSFLDAHQHHEHESSLWRVFLRLDDWVELSNTGDKTHFVFKRKLKLCHTNVLFNKCITHWNIAFLCYGEK